MKIYVKFEDVSYVIEYDKCNFVCGVGGLIANCEGKTYGLINPFSGVNKVKVAQNVMKLFFDLCSRAKKIDADVEIDNTKRNSEGIPHMVIINNQNTSMGVLIYQVNFDWINSVKFGTSNSVIVIEQEEETTLSENTIKRLIVEKAKSSSIYDNDFEVEKINEVKTCLTKEPFAFIGGF